MTHNEPDDAAHGSAPTRRRSATRARLLAAAAPVFAEKGLHGTTVDDVVAAAGYTRGAFYSNFTSKEELFYALFEAESEAMVRLVREEVESSPEELDLGIVGAVLERLRPLARRWYLLQTEFLLHALRDEEGGRRYLEQTDRFDAELADVIRAALRRLGRRATVPIEQITGTLASLYLRNLAVETVESAGRRGRRTTGPAAEGFLEETLPAMLLGFSEPSGPDESDAPTD